MFVLNLRSLRISAIAASLLLAMACASSVAAQSKVTINSDQVLVINGRKVFPVGVMFPPAPGTKTPTGKWSWQELKDAGVLTARSGINSTWDSSGINYLKTYADQCAKYGMYCEMALRDLGNPTTASQQQTLKNLVTTFKNHSGLGLWYGLDEPWWGKVSATQVKVAYDIVKANDLNHPLWLNQAPRGTVADLQPYNAACDITGIDIYPVGYPPGGHSTGTNKEISMVGDFTDLAIQSAAGKKPVWMFNQIAWSGVTPPSKRLRFPDFTQERFMAYQSIIHGARGLHFYGGTVQATLNPTDLALGWDWTFWDSVLKRLILEIGDKSTLQPALVAPKSTYPISVNNGIEFTQRLVGTDLYIFACKREGSTILATFSGVPTGYTKGDVLFESPATVVVSNGAFSDWFGPFDVHVYKFKKT